MIFAHSDLAMTQKLPATRAGPAQRDGGLGQRRLGNRPRRGLAHGPDNIVEFLLEKGARIDIFCAAMLGLLDAVKSFLTLQPNLIDAKGPHGFSLHFHAQVGTKAAEPVLDYLQSIKKIELKPVPWLKSSRHASQEAGVRRAVMRRHRHR